MLKASYKNIFIEHLDKRKRTYGLGMKDEPREVASDTCKESIGFIWLSGYNLAKNGAKANHQTDCRRRRYQKDYD